MRSIISRSGDLKGETYGKEDNPVSYLLHIHIGGEGGDGRGEEEGECLFGEVGVRESSSRYDQ